MNITAPDTYSELIAFWNFQEPAGSPRRSGAGGDYVLQEQGGLVSRAEDGVFGPYSARFGEGSWLFLPRPEAGALNRCGAHSAFTLVAWVKREKHSYGGCQAVAGMWNEHALRQYCLFINLQILDSAQQVGAHVSRTGGATPGFKYCMEAAIGATPVPFDVWQCLAITFDGHEAAAWLNGSLDRREGHNPLSYPGELFDGGDAGADFTVGAVPRPDWVDENLQPHGHVIANPFCGLLGGLAMFARALTPEELAGLSGAHLSGRD